MSLKVSRIDTVGPDLPSTLHEDGAYTGADADWTTSPIGGGGSPGGTANAELNIEGGQSVIKSHGAMGATETFDPTDGNVHTGTLDAACTFTLAAPTGTGACTLELRLTQDGTGGWAITWPGSVTLVGSLDTTAGTTSIVIAETLDGGTSWVAVVVGGGGGASATDANIWRPLMDGAGAVVTDGTGQAVMAFGPA
jgi:hypothetical protein